MESIYHPESYRATDNFKTAEYFEKYSETCQFIYTSSEDNKYAILQEMSLTLTDFNEVDFSSLEASCSIDKLRLPCEPVNVPADAPDRLSTKTKLEMYYPLNAKANQLNVIRCKEALEKKWIHSEFKFGNKRFMKTQITETTTSSLKNDIPPGTNFIYSILVYRPNSINHGLKNSTEKLRFSYEIEALGTNTLSQVIDSHECVSNYAVLKEVENTNADLGPFKNAKQIYPSQTVFIDGVFYNDTRSPEAIDYSEPIIKWAKEKDIGTFTVAKMQETLLKSLTPRLGYPYVYIHQGNCEHIITFSDARLIQPSDCLVVEKYPKIVSLSRPSNILCFICSTEHAQWVVMKCDRFPQEKVFLCKQCCDSYLYVDGKKVGDFKLYPFYSQKVI